MSTTKVLKSQIIDLVRFRRYARREFFLLLAIMLRPWTTAGSLRCPSGYNGHRVLNELSLALAPRQIVACFARAAAAIPLHAVIAWFERVPPDGSHHGDEVRPRRLHRTARAAPFGMVFRTTRVPHLTVGENIASGCVCSWRRRSAGRGCATWWGWRARRALPPRSLRGHHNASLSARACPRGRTLLGSMSLSPTHVDCAKRPGSGVIHLSSRT